MKSFLLLGMLIVLASCITSSNKNEKWDFENGHESRTRDELSLSQAEEKYVKLTGKEKFYFINEVIELSISDKNWVKTEKYAKEYLSLAELFKDNWNYGNAIFDANIALSISAFNTNRKLEASKLLVEASKTPSSPQLDSFGPFNRKTVNSHLENLLSVGEKNAVLEFAENCNSFMTKSLVSNKKLSEADVKNAQIVKEINIKRINRFIAQVKENQTPDFKDQ